jgi:hypothetical protein
MSECEFLKAPRSAPDRQQLRPLWLLLKAHEVDQAAGTGV